MACQVHRNAERQGLIRSKAGRDFKDTVCPLFES